MRSLFFDFADDPEAGKVTDGYMFGRSLLVYPVTEPMYYDRNSRPVDREHKRTCYLPAGCGWYDFWTEEYYEGGQYVTVDAPIDRIPEKMHFSVIMKTVVTDTAMKTANMR